MRDLHAIRNSDGAELGLELLETIDEDAHDAAAVFRGDLGEDALVAEVGEHGLDHLLQTKHDVILGSRHGTAPSALLVSASSRLAPGTSIPLCLRTADLPAKKSGHPGPLSSDP